MADISVTVASVVADSGYKYRDEIAGATITAGQPCYLDSTDSYKAKTADANASAATAAVKGIALHAALAGQPVRLITSGYLTVSASGVLTVGTWYVCGSGAGGIAPSADLTSGEYSSRLGVATTTNKLRVDLLATGAVTA